MNNNSDQAICFTNDSEMGDADNDEVIFEQASLERVQTYLEADPRHAVVLGDEDGTKWAIFRGASDASNNFFVQGLPLDDPGDADGGEWTAREALEEIWPKAD